MRRCCQTFWEDLYWNCFEEKFCYDESIANYNPEEDEDYIASMKNGSNTLSRIQSATDNNNLRIPATIITQQPILRNNSSLLSNAKIHEEDLRREIQTNMPMLGPEVLAVFANSQIFQDHQPTKLNRISTRGSLVGVHSNAQIMKMEQDRLLKRLEANLNVDNLDGNQKDHPSNDIDNTNDIKVPASSLTNEKHIVFTITSESSPEGSQTIVSKKFDVIAEEDDSTQNENERENEHEHEIVLRPRLIHRHPHLLSPENTILRRPLRNVKSVPHMNVRAAASETDIFSITGSGTPISMTPEVPSISFTNLPKNYEDTPTIEKYRVSQSLYSIQTANEAKANQDDYSMPRYFRHSAMMNMNSSHEIITSNSAINFGTTTSATTSREDIRRPEKIEKSKRLQMLRGTLPPLLIHSVSFRKNRDESKQLD